MENADKRLPAVLHVINSLSVGGAERLLSQLVTSQVELGQRVGVLVLCSPHDNFTDFTERVSAVATVYKSPYSLRNPRQVFEIIRVVRAFRPDVVHVHLFPAQLWAALASLWCNRTLPWVTTEHSTWNRRRGVKLLIPFETWMYKRYDNVISATDAVKSALLNWVNINSSHLAIIPNGISLNAVQMSRKIPRSERKEFTVITVTRLEPAKDLVTLLNSIALIPAALRLKIVGDGVDRVMLEALSKRLGITHRVDFLGMRTDVPALLQDADVYVQSSHWEGIPLAVIEGMAAGLPIVASDVPGLSELVKNYGLLFPQGDAHALGIHLNRIMLEPELGARLSTRSLDRARDFAIEKTAKACAVLYTDLVALRVDR